ncbi:MTFP1 [Cordylochernes scorpioides]|uniref:Mitochondrial fission process protein 1 n=1 Tax=Cordylochernes scorpioides TaxID=51811 RepID=A0ABY6K867_9ARAC|nr:MTFP1 [Cordylochernes scorpioides]
MAPDSCKSPTPPESTTSTVSYICQLCPGYANEVGEAFRALVPRVLVHGSYALAIAYVLADTMDKVKKTQKQLGYSILILRSQVILSMYLPQNHPNSAPSHIACVGLDTLVWQGLASVAIPGLTINRLCATSLWTLQRVAPSLPLVVRKWTTTAIGLGCIPFIVHPIDHGVDRLLDSTLRPMLQLPPKYSD